MKKLLLFAMLLTSAVAVSQCWLVNDEAGILKNQAQFESAANALTNEGADVKVVTVASLARYGGNLTAVEMSYEHSCSSWRSPAGTRKANLVVFMVAPNDRKKNIFFGSAYTGAFPNEDLVNTLYSHAANPYFANKEWEQGLSAAMKDFAAKVVAYHDQQQHPATTTINQQATDLSGLWLFLFCGLGVVFIVLIAVAVSRLRDRRAKEKKELDDAEAEALQEFNEVNRLYLEMPKDRPDYASISYRFSVMSNSVKFDPNEDMSAVEYRAVAKAWRDLRWAIEPEARPSSKPQAPLSPEANRVAETQQANQVRQRDYVPAPSVTVVNSGGPSSDGFLTGMLVGDALGSRREPEPVYREPEPEPVSPSWGNSGSDSGSSGSDSSWSSSDSGSSGPDSSFGSSDSGGGSGSDSSW